MKGFLCRNGKKEVMKNKNKPSLITGDKLLNIEDRLFLVFFLLCRSVFSCIHTTSKHCTKLPDSTHGVCFNVHISIIYILVCWQENRNIYESLVYYIDIYHA
jgi:hypothetical protein